MIGQSVKIGDFSMFNSKLLITLLTVFCIISFPAEVFGFSNTADSGWKASPELIEALMKRRSETNYSEQRVPKYTLPNPLVLSDGTRVTSAGTWRT